MSPTGAPPPPPPPPPPTVGAATAPTGDGPARGGPWARFRARSRRFQVISWVLVAVLVLSVISALASPVGPRTRRSDASDDDHHHRPADDHHVLDDDHHVHDDDHEAAPPPRRRGRRRRRPGRPTTTSPPTTTAPSGDAASQAALVQLAQPAGEGPGAEDRLRPGPVRAGVDGRRRRDLRPQRLRHPQRHAPRGPAAHRGEARDQRLRGAQRRARRSVHRPHDPVRPRPAERRRPDRPRGGPVRRLAEGRPAAQRRRSARTSPTTPATCRPPTGRPTSRRATATPPPGSRRTGPIGAPTSLARSR